MPVKELLRYTLNTNATPYKGDDPAPRSKEEKRKSPIGRDPIGYRQEGSGRETVRGMLAGYCTPVDWRQRSPFYMQVKLRRRLHTPDIGKEARAEEQEEVLER
ncbi:hypothetical protein BVC80_739g4 [Macleaya cordata]|uniref:Uncharacterized protein n=1 Tax=Macleaya cordata TaxID=56857 RepID=A0A200PY85_MACCD|nr:hypothetical protein BVC80_739g4 [Macleaya cordata]